MLSKSHYFVETTNNKTNPGVDLPAPLTPPRGANFAKTFSGKYEFNLGPISYSFTGTAHVKGEFPRLEPRFERSLVKNEEIEELSAGLTAWVEKHFDVKTDAEYFKKLVHTSWLFSIYIHPLDPTESKQMEVLTRIIFWFWHLDDIFELAISGKIPTSKIEKALDQYVNVLNEQLKPYEDIEGCPGFKPLHAAFVDIRQSFIDINIPIADLGTFRKYMSVFFGGLRWASVETVNASYTEETYKYWRRINAFCDALALLIFRLLGKKLNEKILAAPSFRRLLDTFNSISAFVNDLVGLRKDFQFGERDNLVMFKVYQKGMPLGQAASEVCTTVKDDLHDFMVMRNLVIKEFQYDYDLLTFIYVLEAFIDGNNKFYSQSHRHLSAGLVKLSNNT